MEIKSRKLVLTFGTPLETTLDLTISNPDTELQPADIKTAMEAIVATGAIGDVVQANSVKTAKYVIQQVDTIALV